MYKLTTETWGAEWHFLEFKTKKPTLFPQFLSHCERGLHSKSRKHNLQSLIYNEGSAVASSPTLFKPANQTSTITL